MIEAILSAIALILLLCFFSFFYLEDIYNVGFSKEDDQRLLESLVLTIAFVVAIGISYFIFIY